jgi:hypothetical protein
MKALSVLIASIGRVGLVCSWTAVLLFNVEMLPAHAIAILYPSMAAKHILIGDGSAPTGRIGHVDWSRARQSSKDTSQIDREHNNANYRRADFRSEQIGLVHLCRLGRLVSLDIRHRGRSEIVRDGEIVSHRLRLVQHIVSQPKGRAQEKSLRNKRGSSFLRH